MNPKWKNIDYKKGLIEALDILENYSKCKNVNTSRLHCYLPCLAMGVPVNFISPNGDPKIKTWGSKDRFNGLRELQDNPDKFLELKTKLVSKTSFELRKQILENIFNTGKDILSKNGDTKINLVIKNNNKKANYLLHNNRKFDLEHLKALKAKKYVVKINV